MKYIEVSDAIETTWMILKGLGYRYEENSQLAKDVRDVFETAPSTDLRSIGTMLAGKCGSCQFFEYEFKGAKTGFCRGGKHCSKGRIYRTQKCIAYQPREEGME